MYRQYRQKLNTPQTRPKLEENMAGKLKVVMFLGSVREGRLATRVSDFLKKKIEEKNHKVATFDPREMEFPMLDTPVWFFKDRSHVPEKLKWMLKLEEELNDADAFFVVTCEYNRSLPPALTNMLDHFDQASFLYKPCGIVSYSPGPYGGVAAALQARGLLGELGCLTVGNLCSIPEVDQVIDEAGECNSDKIMDWTNKIITQVEYVGQAMKSHKENVGLPAPTNMWA